MSQHFPAILPIGECHWITLMLMNIVYGLVQSDNKPITEPVLTGSWCQMVSLGHNELIQFIIMYHGMDGANSHFWLANNQWDFKLTKIYLIFVCSKLHKENIPHQLS